VTPLLLLAVACATADSDEQTLDASSIQPQLGSGAGEPAPDFVPAAFYLSGWTGLQDGQVVDPDPRATVTFSFWTDEGLRTGDTAERCDWTGHPQVVGPVALNDAGEVWTAAELTLDLVATDCLTFAEEDWGERSPTTALTGQRIALGHGPLSLALHAKMTQLYDRQGMAWGRVADHAFGTWFAVDRGDGFEGVEIGAALAYASDADPPLEPLSWTDELPDGVVFTESVVLLDPAWIE